MFVYFLQIRFDTLMEFLISMSDTILESQIKDIKEIVKKKIDVNIDHYATSFLERRILNQMHVAGITSFSKYISHLEEDPLESLELHANLSINVTQFFRNQNVWDVLKQKIIPEIVTQSNSSLPISIWSAGCAVGNEPYSLAMMFSDILQTKEKKFRVIATDINPTSIGIAKTGQYEFEILKNIPTSFLSKFLEKIDDHLYKFNDDIKKTIDFKVGDITSFGIKQVDIIICRNVLIYYHEGAKDLLFKKFYNTLNDGGFLILGMAEVVPSSMKKFFKTVNSDVKIYQKISA